MSLSPIELKFLQGLISNPVKHNISASAERLSGEFNIGVRIGRWYTYNEKDVARATSLLKSLGLPMSAPSQATDRAGAANRPSISEKSGTIAPHSNSVAYRIFNGKIPSFQPGYAVAMAEEIATLHPDLIIVVENFETFRQLERYEWIMRRLEPVGFCLVLFRGDTTYRLNDAKRCLDALSCPVWGFHDFDPAGLHMSLSIRGLEEHLIPPEAILVQAVKEKKRSDLYFDNIGQYTRVLDECQHEQVARLWSLMKRLQKGFPQEWMRDLM